MLFRVVTSQQPTKTLVSTAVMTSYHLAANRSTHLPGRFRFALGPKAAGHLLETGIGEPGSGTQQDSVTRFFDGEFRGPVPSPGKPGCFWAG
jgi:hypothetical protein